MKKSELRELVREILAEASIPTLAKSDPDKYIKSVYLKAKKDPTMKKFMGSDKVFEKVPKKVFDQFLGYDADLIWKASSSSDKVGESDRWFVDKMGGSKFRFGPEF